MGVGWASWEDSGCVLRSTPSPDVFFGGTLVERFHTRVLVGAFLILSSRLSSVSHANYLVFRGKASFFYLSVFIEVINITGIGIFRIGLLTEQRGDSTLSENSTLASRPHSARRDARRDSRLRTVASLSLIHI